MSQQLEFKRMRIQDFTPDPREIMEGVVADSSQSGIRYGFAHGSMLYKSEGSLTAAYRETRVRDKTTNEVVSIEYTPLFQPPDIDIVAVVDNREAFSDFFAERVTSDKVMAKLNYFFTLNVIQPEILMSETITPLPRALKRILAFRQILPFGNAIELQDAKQGALHNTNESDHHFQTEFDERKKMLEERILAGAQPFMLSASAFKKQFPMLFADMDSSNGGFPEDRDKIVLPKEMGLKSTRFLGDLASSATFQR